MPLTPNGQRSEPELLSQLPAQRHHVVLSYLLFLCLSIATCKVGTDVPYSQRAPRRVLDVGKMLPSAPMKM